MPPKHISSQSRAPAWPVPALQPVNVFQSFVRLPPVDYGPPPGELPPLRQPDDAPDGSPNDAPPGIQWDELQDDSHASPNPLKRKGLPDGYTKVLWERLHSYTDVAVTQKRQEWDLEWAGKIMPPPPPGVFETKDQAVESVKDFAKKNGYKIIIAHNLNDSDGQVYRLGLTCKYAGTYKNPKTPTPELRQRNRFSRKTGCPMKMRIARRTHAPGWVSYFTNPKHNHAPEPSSTNLPPSEHPDVEAALYEWHMAELAKGESPHGNSLKAKALALFADKLQFQDPPNLDSKWLNQYRMRHDLLGNNYVRPTGPPVLIDWDDPNAVAAVTANINPPRSRESIAFAGVHSAFDDDALIMAMKTSVREFMSRYDGSHDWDHILRVLSLTKRLLRKEMQPTGPLVCDVRTAYLAAICHDLGDHKYVKPGEDVENQIAEMLLQHGAPAALALKVQLIAKNVSYSNEIKNPLMMKAVLDQHPELAIVQDADRLDAIGAIGIGRTFLFTGAKRPNASMTETIDHFKEKLERLESMMKTATGREIARERTQRLKSFRSWWEEEYELTE